MKKNTEKNESGVKNGSVADGASAEAHETVGNYEAMVENDAKITELTQDLQRTRADFENFRKQVDVQKENERKMAKLATVGKVLPLIDDIDRAIASYEELKPLGKSLEKVMNGLGLKKIPSDEGVEFDPDLHDAMMVEGEGGTEVIAETLRPGYYYETEVLRPAMVKVKRR